MLITPVENINRELTEMKKLLLMIVAVFIFSACASNEPKRTDVRDLDLDNAVTENGEKLYCKRESATGSHLKTTTCLTKAEKDAARKNSEELVNRMKRTPELKSSEPGGG